MSESEHLLLVNESRLFSFDDSLYCQEEHWEELRDDCSDSIISDGGDPDRPTPQIATDQHLFFEEHELSSLLSKETVNRLFDVVSTDPNLAMARREAIEWILKVHAHYSFALQTALLAVNYLDRFLFSFNFHEGKPPWLPQLTAVACLSLAAKIEETYVPLLLDLQMEETKYLFEAKRIQQMEILVLSTLEWKMHPVTPYSFLDYMARRLGLKGHLCREFLRRCEVVLLATLFDSRFMCYLPSAVAAATMLHVISSVETCIGVEHQTELLDVLGACKERVKKCNELIVELEEEGKILLQSKKRKPVSRPRSPNGVIDVSFSSDSSDDWRAASSSSSSSVSSSPASLKKRKRV